MQDRTTKDSLVVNAEQLGQTLRGVRRELGWTQAEVGLRMGVPQKEISKMETGTGKTSVERLFLLLSALNLEFVIRPRDTDLDGNLEW